MKNTQNQTMVEFMKELDESVKSNVKKVVYKFQKWIWMNKIALYVSEEGYIKRINGEIPLDFPNEISEERLHFYGLSQLFG